MPVSIDGFGVLNSKEIDSNAVVSVFAKGNSVESMLNDALLAESYGNKAMFYWNKKEALSLLQRARVQYPSSLPQDGFIHSIRENGAFVNYRLENVTHSKQFKDWFGDWRKNPKKASKVVNEDGTPKVVYHGTNTDVNIFDLNETGKNYPGLADGMHFFTNKKDGYVNSASDYAKNAVKNNGGNEIIKEVYLDIKKPLRLDSRGYYSTNEYYDRNVDAIQTKYLDGDYDGIIIENSDKGSDDAILYIVDNSKQIKSATDNIGTFDPNNPDVRYSFASQNDIDSALADFEAHYGEMYSNLIDKYKSIKPGEIPQVEDVKVPKKTGKRQYVSNYARTMAETRVFSEAMQGEFEKMVVDGTLSHERISNKSAESDAGSRIVRLGFKNAFE